MLSGGLRDFRRPGSRCTADNEHVAYISLQEQPPDFVAVVALIPPNTSTAQFASLHSTLPDVVDS